MIYEHWRFLHITLTMSSFPFHLLNNERKKKYNGSGNFTFAHLNFHKARRRKGEMKLYRASFSRFHLKIKRYKPIRINAKTRNVNPASIIEDVCMYINRYCYSWPITGFMTRVTWRVSLMYQELLTITVHMTSSSVFVSIHVVQVV